ncbi:MAG: Ig-like domain repeat protein [Chloroflexi bacterium]|nr:Ig-like domain repeat protein [Chloroflexota bacterium]
MHRSHATRLGVVLVLAVIGFVLVVPPGSLSSTPNIRPPSSSDLPPASQAAISNSLGRVDRAYHFSANERGYHAINLPEHLAMQFGPGEATITTGRASWNIALRAWGYGNVLEPVAAAALKVSENHIEFHHLTGVFDAAVAESIDSLPQPVPSTIIERYSNGPLGLEQTFVVTSRPTAGEQPLSQQQEAIHPSLTLAMDLGDWQAGLDDDQAGLTLRSREGSPFLHYGGLTAFDASGHQLPARLDIQNARLLVRVNDRNAHYPITIDPLVQQAKLTASDGMASDSFGFSVTFSASGDTALVGSYGAQSERGAAYIFTRSGATWTEQKLLASGGAPGERFGWSVALSADGNTAIVGARWATVDTKGRAGAAYVFTRSGLEWTEHKLTASDGAADDNFGFSVALSADGNTALVGAFYATVAGASQQGAAYVFSRTDSTWTEQKLYTSAAPGEYFGASVGLSGDGNTALIGAYGAQSYQGTVYVFRHLSLWTQEARLTAVDGVRDDYFAKLAAISSDGSTALVGAPYAAVLGHAQQGAAYIFTRSGSTWTGLTKLTASDGAATDNFGLSVSLNSNGSVALVGAPFAHIGSNADQGAAYMFALSGSAWIPQERLLASDGGPNAKFGTSVAATGDGSGILVGASGATVETIANQGAAYLSARTTKTSVAVSQNPVVFGQVATFTAAVTSDIGAPTGSVVFQDGATALGSASLSNGVATFSLATLGTGYHTITAEYSGDGEHLPSSDSLANGLTILKANTTLSITSSGSPTVFGQSVTFTATLAVVPPGEGIPTGTFTFAEALGTRAPFRASSTPADAPTWSTTALSVGSHTIFVQYSGDDNFNGSASSGLAHTVDKADTTASITFHVPDPSVVGQSVAISYTVAVTEPGGGTPTGNVLVGDGTNTCTDSVATGACNITFMTAGSHTLTASFQGDANYKPSLASPGQSHTVNKANTITTLSSSTPSSSNEGAPFTVNFTVAPKAPGAGTPTGTVTVADGDATCQAALPATSCSLTLFNPGARNLTATFSGNANYIGSAASASHSIANLVPTLTALSRTTSSQGSPGFTLTVTGSNFISGSVVQWKGNGLTTSFVSATQLSATVPNTLLSSAGSASITVRHPGTNGDVSNALTYTVSPVQPSTSPSLYLPLLRR